MHKVIDMFKYDWNGNRKRDIVDEYFDYKIFEEITKEDTHKSELYLDGDSKYELARGYYSNKKE